MVYRGAELLYSRTPRKIIMNFSAPLSLRGFAVCIGIASVLIGALPNSGWAAGKEGDLYLQAYILAEDATEAMDKGRLEEAHQKLLKANVIFDNIAAGAPAWKPHMVKWRRQETRAKLKEVREEAAKRGIELRSGLAAAPAPGQPEDWTAPRVPGRSDLDLPVPAARPTKPNNYNRVVPKNTVRAPAGTARPPAPANPGRSSLRPPAAGQARSVHQRLLAQYQDEIDRYSIQNSKLVVALREKENLANTMEDKAKKAEEKMHALQIKLSQAQHDLKNASRDNKSELMKRTKEVESLQKDVKTATIALGEANAKTSEALEELENANATIKEMEAAAKKVHEERDQMAALLNAAQDNPQSPESLIIENARLKKELQDAKALAIQLGEANELKDEQIAQLRERVETIEKEVALLREENENYKSTIATLQTKLKKTGVKLVNTDFIDVPALEEENKMLRQIIIRQLREQSKRQQIKEFVLKELSQRQVDSTELLSNIEVLAGPPITLSKEERALFKDPRVLELVGQSGFQGTTAGPAGPGDGKIVPRVEQRDPNETTVIGEDNEVTEYAKAAAWSFEHGRYDEAERSYERILRINPHDVYSLCNLGVVKIRLASTMKDEEGRRAKYSESEFLLKKALVYDSEHATSHFMLAVNYYNLGKIENSMRSINRAAQLDPENSRIHHYLGFVASTEGWPERAERAYKRAIELDPKYAEAHYNLAVLYATSPEPSQTLAREHYQQALSLGARRDRRMEQYLGS